MKRILSILMCALLLYNIMGFSLVYWVEGYFSFMEKIESFADHSSGKEDFIVIKIPIMIPYQTDWQVAEPAEGRLRRGDDFYQIIEQQLMNDTLHVKCKLDLSARDRYLDLVMHVDQHVKGGAPGSSSKTPHLLKDLLKDYMTFNRRYLFFIMQWLDPMPSFGHYVAVLQSISLRVASPPPW